MKPAVTSSKAKWAAVAILAVYCLAILGIVLRNYQGALPNDIALYAVNAHEIRLGKVFYKDVWEIKPPGSIYLYLLAELVAGYGLNSIFILSLTASLLTLFGIYRAAESSHGKAAGLFAGACWVLVSMAPSLEGARPNVEVLMNAGLACFFAAMLCLPSRPTLTRMMWMGVFAGLVTLLKQYVVVIVAFVLLPHLFFAWRSKSKDVTGAGAPLQLLGFSAGFGIVWVLTFLHLRGTGGLAGFLGMMTDAGKSYSGSPFTNIRHGLTHPSLVVSNSRFLWPLIILTLLGFVTQWKSSTRSWAMLAAYAASVQICVSLPGRDYVHYYLLWLPVFCIGAGWAIGGWYHQGRASKLAKWAAPVAAVASLALVFYSQTPFFRHNPTEMSLHMYGDIYLQTEKLGKELGENLKPPETIYEWGMETGLYFYSGLRPASSLDWSALTPVNTILNVNPRYKEWTAKFREDINRTKPVVFVVNEPLAGGENYDWMMAQYRPFPGDNRRGIFLLYVRRGSQLEKQMYPG